MTAAWLEALAWAVWLALFEPYDWLVSPGVVSFEPPAPPVVGASGGGLAGAGSDGGENALLIA